MGVLNDIRNFLLEFRFEGEKGFADVWADIPAAECAGVAAKGEMKQSRDILGNLTVERQYTVLLELPMQFEVDRRSNNELLDAFEDWIFEKNSKRELPELSGGKKATGIFCCGRALREIEPDGRAVYALGIKIIYEMRSIEKGE